MKPGQMKNLAAPQSGKGLSAVAQTASTSLNTPETTQQSMNADRLVPPRRPMGPSGQANIEEGDVLEGMPIYTEGTKVTQRARKRYLTLP